MDLLRYLEKEILFKVSVGSGDLLRHLEKEILFKMSLGSEDLLRDLEKKFPSRYPWALRIY